MQGYQPTNMHVAALRYLVARWHFQHVPIAYFPTRTDTRQAIRVLAVTLSPTYLFSCISFSLTLLFFFIGISVSCMIS